MPLIARVYVHDAGQTEGLRSSAGGALAGCAGDRRCCGDRGAVRACARRSAAPPSNDLLIVGYDREPDTLNRFSTHILEDIQTCVVEGLTTTDERMNVIPLLATEVPTPENGGVRIRPDDGMDVTWKLRPGVTWHDGTPVHVGGREVHGRRDQRSELQPRKH